MTDPLIQTVILFYFNLNKNLDWEVVRIKLRVTYGLQISRCDQSIIYTVQYIYIHTVQTAD